MFNVSKHINPISEIGHSTKLILCWYILGSRKERKRTKREEKSKKRYLFSGPRLAGSLRNTKISLATNYKKY
jgi:hypothetical protein